MTHAERRILGRYELLESLGRGVATEAFRAKSFGVEGFQKTILVKRVLPEAAASPAFLQAFLEHMPRAMRLSHQNLAQVVDVGKVDEPTGSTYFVAAEYVAGMDVATLLARARQAGEAIPVPMAVYLALEVAKALDHAHRRRDEQLRPLAVLHGALAPHAVRVSFDGDVKVTDFGLSRALLALDSRAALLQRVHAAGSPEQAAGGSPTVTSEVFSLGAFLHAVLSGEVPFLGATVDETRQNVRRADLPFLGAIRPEVPGEVAAVVSRALSVDPGERFGSVSAFHEELLAASYACGLRSAAVELAAMVERLREAPPTSRAERIEALLARPLTLPPVSLSPAVGPEDSPAPLSSFGERRHVSLLAFAWRGGAESVAIRREKVASIVGRYGGSITGEEPEAVMALFGLDRSDGRDTEQAVRAGLVLLRHFAGQGGRVGVGIDSGRLRLGSGRPPLDDPDAASMIGAARSLSDAANAETLVSREASSSLRGRFSLEPSGPGIRVLEFAQDRSVDSFVGRADELHQLGETLVRAARGEGRIVRVVGAEGSGKTRLVIEVQRRLSRGSVDLATHFATCSPRGREQPESGLVTMLRRVCGLHDGDPPHLIETLEPRLRSLGMSADEASAVMVGLGGGGTPHRRSPATSLRGAFVKLLHGLSEDRFTVFAWDDAHELDAASCDVLSRAIERLGTSRLAIILAGRAGADGPFAVMPAHAEVSLGELSAAETERLVAERAGVSEVPEALLQFLRERAGGQPLFVEELVRQMIESGRLITGGGQVTELRLGEALDLPRSLRALTAERLRRLTPDERDLFVAASVLEPPVEASVLATLLSRPLAAVKQVVDALVSRGLLAREGRSSLGVASPLAREVVLAELDPEETDALHLRAADALRENLGARLDEQADEVGFHLASAGSRNLAATYYARAGLYWLKEGQLERATQGLTHALGLWPLEPENAEQVAAWLRALSSAVCRARTGPNLPELLAVLAERLRGTGYDPVAVARMRIDLASILGAIGDELAGEALLDETATEARLKPGLTAALLTTYAELSSGRGDFRATRRALDPLSRMTVTDPGDLHRLTLAKARSLSAAGTHEAAMAMLRETERAASPEDPFRQLDCAIVRTSIYLGAGALRDAAGAAAAAARQAEELGLTYEVASSLCDQAVAFARLGDVSRARAAAESALVAAEECGGERVLLRVRLLCGFLDASSTADLPMLREHLARQESHGWLGDALLGRFLLARVASRLGELHTARAELALGSKIASKVGNAVMAEVCDADLAGLS